MKCRDLLLPDGMALQLFTDEIIPPERADYPFAWDGPNSLAGDGVVNGHTGTRQPYVGCTTGGDVIAHLLMLQLAREYLPKRQEGDDDPRWNLL